MDSVLLASNIRQTGRLQLLVEVLQRVHRMLNPGHQTQYAETFAPYVKEHAGHYLYRLKREDYATHMQQIGETMQRLLDELRSCYEQETAYQRLMRVFEEHFKLTSETVTPKSAEELSASSLQSPLLHQCPAQPARHDPSHKLRFTQAEALAAQRHRRHQSDRRCAGNLRAAVEATIRSVKHPFPAGKLPIRGLFRVACMVIGSAALSNYLKNQKLAKVTRKNIQKHLNCDQNAALKSFFSSLYNRFYRLVTTGSSISFFPC